MNTTREQQIRGNLRRLAAIHSATMSVFDESAAILQSALDALSRPEPATAAPVKQGDGSHSLSIDRTLMCVVYRGKQCFLGNSLKLKFLERIALRPDQYVSYDALLTDVWNGDRELSSVRSVVKELRSRLRAAGMSDLADVIDGRVSGHYGLMLGRLT